MFKKIILLMVLFVTLDSYAQIITITDQETGEGLQTVSLLNTTPTTIAETDENGKVDISEFKGAERIQIISLGHKKVVMSYAELVEKKNIELEKLSFSTDAIVVSATKWTQNAQDIPIKITRIDPAEIALQNPQTAADMLTNSGGVFMQKSQFGGGSPMIRGFATNRLLYSVDGIRMNTAIFRGGNIQNVISLDPFSIAEAEILFGPGSELYGSDAIGAVMSFQTLKPKLSTTGKTEVSGNAVTRYSTASNEKTAHFDINVGWEKWALLTSFSNSEYGDLKMGSNGPDEYLRPFYVERIDSVDVMVTNKDPKIQSPSGFSQMNLMQKLYFKPNEKWDFEYAFHYSESSAYARYDRHIRYKDGLPRYGEWSYGPQKWMMNNLKISHNSQNAVYDQLSARIAYQNFEESRISRDFNKFIRETNQELVDAFSINIDFNKALGKRNHLYYGLEYVQNDVHSTGAIEDISTGVSQLGASRYPEANWLTYGAYLTNQIKVNEKFLIRLGARYSQYQLNATFDTSFYPFPFTDTQMNNGALTGNVGFVYRPNKKLILTANASTGFRSPNVDDMGKVFDSEPGAVVVPNTDLSSEYAYNAELGVTKIFGDFAKLELTGYYTLLQNALVRRDYTLNGEDSIVYAGELSKVQAIQNAAVANVYGLQAGIEVNLGHGFRLLSKLNYQVGEEELDDGSISPSRHAAPIFGVTRFTYSHKKLKLQFYSEYSGEKSFANLPISEQAKDYLYAIDDNGNPYSPAWYTVNFKAIYQFSGPFSISTGIENLTDQRYKTYSSGIAAPGRNFIISLRAKF